MSNDQNFDFRTVSEEPENLDFSKLVKCPHCQKPIPQDATMCLYCGRETSKKASWIVWVAIAVIITFGLIVILI